MVFFFRPVVVEGADNAQQLRIGGTDGAGVALCADVFAGIEGEGGGVAEAAGGMSGHGGTNGLCVVFQQDDAAASQTCGGLEIPRRVAVKGGQRYEARAVGGVVFSLVQVYAMCGFVRVYQPYFKSQLGGG